MKKEFIKYVNPGLIITTNMISLLRKTLFEQLGQKQAGKYLLKLGRELGEEKARELLSVTGDIGELLEMAELLHKDIGHISRLNKRGTITKTDDGVILQNVRGSWQDSFEVAAHLQYFERAEECTCYIISGFMSGVISEVYGTDIFVKETTCIAKGDEVCNYEINTRGYWESQGEALPIYETDTFIDELEMTYDKLVKKTDTLSKVINFHSTITDTIAQQNDIQKLLDTAFDILKIPMFIINLNGDCLFEAGKAFQSVNIKLTKLLKNIEQTKVVKTAKHCLLIAPVTLDHKKFGYACFLYEHESQIDENDQVYIERLAIATNLCLLNEKVSFEATERLKITFLDRLVFHHFKDLAEANLHANYIEPQITPMYHVFSINLVEQSNSAHTFDLYEIIYNLARMLKKYNLNGLLNSKDNRIILFAYNVSDIKGYIDTFKVILNNIVPTIRYKIGVSREFDSLSDFHKSLAEAEKAMNFPTKESFAYYEQLGIYSTLLENLQTASLRQIARQELKTLLDPDEKNKVLLFTLYTYLKNNQKLEKTMHDLSLSIGGIKYRLTRIEKIIGKKIKDATTFAFLLILIESLLLAKEISFDEF